MFPKFFGLQRYNDFSGTDTSRVLKYDILAEKPFWTKTANNEVKDNKHYNNKSIGTYMSVFIVFIVFFISVL